ncbi:MAG: glutamate mutase L [Chloroflexi bacterium]|nr:glutamate mutase L [Chloroflexota bacterium]
MSTENINSILVADLGNVHTRLVLIDLVEGQYRLIASARARTTAEPPLGKVALGLEHAVQSLTNLIGREILSRDGENLFITPESGGHGIDMFLATGSAGRPMRVFMVGLTSEVSIPSGQRVLAGSYITLTDMLSPDDFRSEEEQINAILSGEPDMILIVGGTDNGADDILLELVHKVARALSLIRHGVMPSVLFAGNKTLRPQVKALLEEYTNVFFAKNVRTSYEEESVLPAQVELAVMYDEYRTKSPGGFAEVGRYSMVGVVPTTQGYISAMRYLNELPQKGIGPLCIDVGSANSTILGGAHKELHYIIRTDLGVGHNAVNALNAVQYENVTRWLPFDITADALRDYMHNKQLRPTAVPGSTEDLMIEQALAREIVRMMFNQAREAWDLGEGELLPNFQPIIAAGAILTEAQHPGVSAMLLLDALQPTGLVELRLDPHNLISSLGVVAYLKPVATVQAMETGGLISLGTAFCPLGHVRQGRDAMVVQIKQQGAATINHTVRGGEIWMAPLLPGLMVDVTVKLRHGLRIDGKRRIKRRVITGAAGLIFDARGRPLVLPRPKDRAMRYLDWQMAMMGRERRVKAADVSAAEEEPLPDLESLVPELDDIQGRR